MMKKDEPPVLTLVLLNARVLLVLDWLNDAKNFVLLNTDFVPPGILPCCLFTCSFYGAIILQGATYVYYALVRV